jgi:type I restriction enzyme S subunit
MRAAASAGVFVAHGNPNTIPHLTAEKLRVCRLPFPPPDEQGAIVAFLDGETSRIDALLDEVNLSIDRLREYRTTLISAAVTGKIDVSEETF